MRKTTVAEATAEVVEIRVMAADAAEEKAL